MIRGLLKVSSYKSYDADTLTGLAVRRRLIATGAEFCQLKAIRRIATVLTSDVVAILATLAGEGDLGANIRRLACHFPSSSWS